MSGVESVLTDYLEEETKSELPIEDPCKGNIPTEGTDSDGGESWIVVEEDLDKLSEEEENESEVSEFKEELSSTEKQSSSNGVENLPEEDSNLSIQYPQALNNYSHKPNQELNVFLTASVFLGIALALGFGFGHFLGWSERLEGFEVNRTALPEGDNLVIQELKSENQKLRMQIDESTILHKEILLENSKLESEIKKLRLNRDILTENLASKESIEELRSMLDQTNSFLWETKEKMNDIKSENEILKIQVGKARYGKPVVPLDEKERIDKLKMENEELKQEVREMNDIHSHYDQYSYDQESDEPTYSDYFWDFLKESTERTRVIMDKVKSKFDSEVNPFLEDIQSMISEKWSELENFKKSCFLGPKNGQFSYLSFLMSLEGCFRNSKKEDVHENPDLHNKEEKDNQEDKNSWYFRRGKDREIFLSQDEENEGDKKSSKIGEDSQWLFQRASSRKENREGKAHPPKKVNNQKNKYFKHNDKNDWKSHNKRSRGD